MQVCTFTDTVERCLSERLLSGPVFLSNTCTVYEYVFEQCAYSLERQSLKNAWNKPWPDLEGEKDFNDDHREAITDLVQSIPGFQECDEDVETWMACDAEDCGFQMLNDDEIVTSVQEESDPVDDETDEDEVNNNESSKAGTV
ncbi:uncharacterized protein TNCV_2705281 [Trichonephila clavipes]|nr:uncharacterized protein TNCV_2705281 [Trichonephila clavipes]